MTTQALRPISDDIFEDLRLLGYAVVPGVFDQPFLDDTRRALHRAYAGVIANIGTERLGRARELGVLRNMFVYDAHFYRLLDCPQIVEIVDRTVGSTAILHLQNGFILPSLEKDATPQIFQNVFHRDFPRYLNGYVASINVMVAVDAFDANNGATLVVPGSQQLPKPPCLEYLERHAISVTCPAGSLLIFDSTLWHAAGLNTSGKERMAINHQFTRSWIKQQIDYVRAIGSQEIERRSPRLQQLLGMHTRVVTSLDEYYQPEEDRLYRRGQG